MTRICSFIVAWSIVAGGLAQAQEPDEEEAAVVAPIQVAPVSPPIVAAPPVVAPPVAAPPALPPPIVAPALALPAPYPYRLQLVEGPPRSVPRVGLSVAGGVMLGTSWSATFMASVLTGQWLLGIPFLGPLIEIGAIHSQSYGTGAGILWIDFMLVSDALLQIGGLALAIAGARHHKVPGRQQLLIVPTGTGIAGRF